MTRYPLLHRVHRWMLARVHQQGAQYGAYGLFGCLNAPLYYLIWCHIAPETYESPIGRVISFILCLLLLLHRQWPTRLRPFLPHYWYVTLCITLPGFFAYMFVMNGGSAMWLANNIVMLFFLLCLVDTQSAWVLLIVGSCLGSGMGLLHLDPGQRYHLWATLNYPGICLTYSAAIMIALCFLHNRERFETLKCHTLQHETESQEKAAIIANLSHDLRTPLSGLVGLSDPQLDPSMDLQQRLSLIHQSAKQLHQLFETVLDTLRLDQPVTCRESRQCFELTAWLTRLEQFYQPALVGRSLQLIMQADPVRLTSYPVTLQRIVMVLLHNALQYTDRGIIDVRAHYQAGELTIAVKDTGRGITEADQQKLFRALTRLTPSYKQADAPGLGLGLYTARRWAEQLGGQLTVTSSGIGQGSTFTLTVPVDDAKALENCRILLVEDSRTSAHAACFVLQRALPTCEITHVETAAGALEAAYHAMYDLVLMDLGLPDGDGQHVAQTLLTDPQSRNRQTPIVAVTAHANAEIVAACRAVKMVDVINKPLRFEQVQHLLAQYCQGNAPEPTRLIQADGLIAV